MLHLMVEQKMLLQCRDGCFEHFPLCPHLLNLMLMFMNYFAIGKTKLSSHLIEVFGLKSLTNYARILWRNVSGKLYQVQVVQAGGGPQGPSEHSTSIWAEKLSGKQAPSALDSQRRWPWPWCKWCKPQPAHISQNWLRLDAALHFTAAPSPAARSTSENQLQNLCNSMIVSSIHPKLGSFCKFAKMVHDLACFLKPPKTL